MPQIRCIDPAEENDADDEGEIWYNPIPEDEEPHEAPGNDPPSGRRLAAPPQDSQAPKRRPSRGWDGGPSTAPDTSNNPAWPEGLREGGGVTSIAGGGGGGGGDGSQWNATHSTEAPHLHRQMLACKSQEEAGASASRATGEEGNGNTYTQHTHTHKHIHAYLPFLPLCFFIYLSIFFVYQLPFPSPALAVAFRLFSE